jgi:hypothetical protein
MHPTDENGDCAASMEMPRYVSHKKVLALEIEHVSVGEPYRMRYGVDLKQRAKGGKVKGRNNSKTVGSVRSV